ncbi:MAG TPA: class I adenylate-forming enzyme family protein, partial [Pseudonocardia sp.]
MWRYADIRTTADIVRHWAKENPEGRALTYGEREVSYRELDSRSSRIARAIQASGAQPGSAIGFLAKNSVEFFEVWFGAMKAGCSIAPFNWRCTAHELARIIDDARPPLVVASEEFAGVAGEAEQLSDHRFEIVAFDPDRAEGDGLDGWLAGRVDDDATDPHVPLLGTETALLAYTSGTTGR